eukprot:1143559-Pelagomonas_calceolata.AAC.5
MSVYSSAWGLNHAVLHSDILKHGVFCLCHHLSVDQSQLYRYDVCVLRLEEFLDERPVAVPEVFWGLLADCCGYLGPAHWTTHRMNLINAGVTQQLS